MATEKIEFIMARGLPRGIVMEKFRLLIKVDVEVIFTSDFSVHSYIHNSLFSANFLV